jgi:PTS system nitrogen regulatory IIA component
MTTISDLLVPEAVLAGMSAANKKGACSSNWALPPRAPTASTRVLVTERLAEREKLGSTGFGGGIAIPHGKLDGLRRVVRRVRAAGPSRSISARWTICRSIWCSCCSRRSGAGADHLKALACVSRALRDRAISRPSCAARVARRALRAARRRGGA